MRHRARRGRMAWPTWINVVPPRRRPQRRRAWLSPAQWMLLLVNCLVVGTIVAALWRLR